MQSGIEKMVASMLGITPEQMEKMVSDTIGLLTTLDARLQRIEKALNVTDENSDNENGNG